METDGKNNLFWIFKMIQTIKSDKWCCLCQNRVQIWIPLGQKHIERAIMHDPTTFGYEVMTKSNIGWRPYWILRLWRRQWAPALAPSKNEFSVFWSTSVPNFMLVDKCAQKIPKLLHYTLFGMTGHTIVIVGLHWMPLVMCENCPCSFMNSDCISLAWVNLQSLAVTAQWSLNKGIRAGYW